MQLPVVYGVTHSAETGALEARVPRATKVSIGKPKDSGLHVYMATTGANRDLVFVLEIGRGQKDPEVRKYPVADIGLLKRDYAALMKDPSVVKRNRPEKLAYFTFSKDAGDGTYIADIDCIQKHGIKPREIDIIITEDGALGAGYEFWTASKLKCFGDGRNGWRSVNFTANKDDEAAAHAAIAAGKKWFPIIDGCFTRGCEYAQTAKNRNGKDVKQCGLSGSLAFQLVNDIRLGAKAEINTTSGRSIRQLMASLVELATFTGGGDSERGTVRGIPLVMSVGQFKTNHNNIPGIAYALRLEFRAESVEAIQQKIMHAAKTFGGMMPMIAESPAKQIAAPAVAQIAAPAEEVMEAAEVVDPRHGVDERDDEDDVEAGFRDRQFGDGDGEEDGDGDGAVDDTPAETFDAAKAELMLAAEAGEQPPAKEEKSPERLFAESLGGGRYEDPGEQKELERSGRRGRGVTFGK